MDKFTELQALVATAAGDAEKFAAGNKAAGTRLRKSMQDAKNLCGEIRKEVLETSKSA